jgi:hypothetical protein
MRDRIYQMFEAIHVAFCKLSEIQFSAPWNPRRGGC